MLIGPSSNMLRETNLEGLVPGIGTAISFPSDATKKSSVRCAAIEIGSHPRLIL
jgi:hypothetical protein